jgi:hypothetical protein
MESAPNCSGAPYTWSTTMAQRSAITTFLKKPQSICRNPSMVRSVLNRESMPVPGTVLLIWFSRLPGRSMGPATSCGQNMT